MYRQMGRQAVKQIVNHGKIVLGPPFKNAPCNSHYGSTTIFPNLMELVERTGSCDLNC